MPDARFPISLHRDESIPGAIARSVRLNVLELSGEAFHDRTYRQDRTGLSSTAAPEELAGIARFLGCDPAELQARAGTRVATAGRHYVIRFGDLVQLRGDIETVVRRISPLSLRDAPWHRLAWIQRRLPFCPVSLERLVDRCDACGWRLGWTRCHGIGTCERCRGTVAPSREPPLPAAAAEAYRLLADLHSPFADVRGAAIGTLPAALRGTPPHSLSALALRLGAFAGGEPERSARRKAFDADPAVLAERMRRGVGLLRDWPAGIREWAGAELAARRHDVEVYREFRHAVRRLGSKIMGDAAQVALVRAALPHEFEWFNRSNLPDGAVQLKDLLATVRLTSPQVAAVRGDLEAQRLPGLRRISSQFDRAKVAEFGERHRGALPLAALAYRSGLPVYGLEQMCGTGLLAPEAHPPLAKLKGACTTKVSAAALAARLAAAARSGPAPDGTVPLHVAARTIGGREKPWAAILQALLDGEVAFWGGGSLATASVRVARNALVAFRDVAAPTVVTSPLVRSMTVTQRDALEILNLDPGGMDGPEWRGALPFEPAGRGLAAGRADVVAIARRLAFGPEVCAVTGWKAAWLRMRLDRMGVGQELGGWAVEDLRRVDILIPRL